MEHIETLCIQYNYQAASFLNAINTNRDHVRNIIEHPDSDTIRFRRGLINIVGRAANVFFGICDDGDATYFYGKIRELKASKSRLLKVVDTQTHIVQSTITNVNNSLVELE